MLMHILYDMLPSRLLCQCRDGRWGAVPPQPCSRHIMQVASCAHPHPLQAAALRNGLHHCLVRLVGEDRAATTAVILGGDLNSLWRKYGADYFDKVRVPALV